MTDASADAPWTARFCVPCDNHACLTSGDILINAGRWAHTATGTNDKTKNGSHLPNVFNIVDEM